MERSSGAIIDVKKQPDSKTGLKLKQKLMNEQSVVNVREGRKIGNMTIEENSIVHAAFELFAAFEAEKKGKEEAQQLYSIFNILDNIINYPFSEEQRILDLPKMQAEIFKQDSTVKFLKTIGFEPSISPDILVFSFDKPLNYLMMAREALLSKVASKLEGEQLSEIERKVEFPMYQKYSEVFGVDLTKKEAKDERKLLMIHTDEAKKIYDETQCNTLEEFVIEMGENSKEFQTVIKEILAQNKRLPDFLHVLKELWLETNVLHRAAMFLRQCFSDPVSRASLSDAKDKGAKFARGILMVDIMDAQGIKKGTKQRVDSIKDLVELYAEREAYIIDQCEDQVAKIDHRLKKALQNDDSVKKTWKMAKMVIVERISRKPKMKRTQIAEPKLLEWVECMDPGADFNDLSEECIKRIDDYKEIKELVQKRNQLTEVNGTNEDNQNMSKKEQDELDQRIQEAIWTSTTWLHESQLVDDFIQYTVMKQIGEKEKVETVFNIKQCFRNFMLQSSPKILPGLEKQSKDKKTQKTKDKSGFAEMAENLYNFSDLQETDQKKMPKGLIFNEKKEENKFSENKALADDAWMHLYRAPGPLAFNGSILNNRYEYMKQYLDRGFDPNIKDIFLWTPLHYAAFIGGIKLIKDLLSRQSIKLEEKNDDDHTPVKVAIEAGNMFGEENVCQLLLEKGAKLQDTVWHKLLILSLNSDITCYVKEALGQGINLHNHEDEKKISLHKVVACNAFKILKFYNDNFSTKDLKLSVKQKNKMGFTVLDLAKKTENPIMINIITKMSEGKDVNESEFEANAVEEEKKEEKPVDKQDSQVQQLMETNREEKKQDVQPPEAKPQHDEKNEEKKHEPNQSFKTRDYDENNQNLQYNFNDLQKKMEENHLKEITEVKQKIIEKDSEVQDLKELLLKQNEAVAKMQQDLQTLIKGTTNS